MMHGQKNIKKKYLRIAVKKYEYLHTLFVVYTGIVVAGIAQSVKGLDGQGIESRRRQNLSHPSRPNIGPTQPPVQ